VLVCGSVATLVHLALQCVKMHIDCEIRVRAGCREQINVTKAVAQLTASNSSAAGFVDPIPKMLTAACGTRVINSHVVGDTTLVPL
jgi:hypothetical protein